jgi:radical SAM protein with 4Fe4S-binding SPASM domain
MPVNEPRLSGDLACIHSSTRRDGRLQCYGKGVNNPPRLPGSYLVIELANRCSLACVHCAVADTSHPHFDSTGYFDVDVADALFEDLSANDIGFDTLILFWLGEPLIHPEFSRIWQGAVRAAARHGTFGKIEVHSNATHLSERKVASLLNESEVPQVIHFSLDATDRDLYLKVKGKDRYDQVVQNIEHFLAEKARLGARWPRPVFQFIVGSNNVEQVGAFRAQWEGACEKVGLPFRTVAGHVPNGEDAIVFFRQLDCPTASLQAAENQIFRDEMLEQGLALPTQADAGETIESANHSICAGFWKSPVISWDGKVTTCTRDSQLHNQVGRLQDTAFSELWWNETMRRRRRMVSVGDYSDMKVCSSCFIPKSLNYTGITVDEVKSWEAAK